MAVTSPWRLCSRSLAVALLLATVAGSAWAQNASTARSARLDPLDAQAPVPAAAHRSALAGYRPLGDDRRLPWRDANEAVNRIGGWRAYAREAQEPEGPSPAVTPAPVPAPTRSPEPATAPRAPQGPRHVH